MKFLLNLTKLFLITAMISSCAAIPGGNIKLENYPNSKADQTLNLKYNYDENHNGLEREYTRKTYSSNGKSTSVYYTKYIVSEHFDNTIARKLIDKDKKIDRLKIGQTSGCVAQISSKKHVAWAPVCFVNEVASLLTLFILPLYCQHVYEAKAQLISQKDNRVLKEYYLKDKAHEVWSLIWMLNPWSWNEPAPETGKRIVEDKIAEALTRQIIHDANQFEECKK